MSAIDPPFKAEEQYLGLGQRLVGYLTPTVVNRLLHPVHVHQRLVALTRLPAWSCISPASASLP